MEIQPGPQHTANFIYTVLKNSSGENLRCVTVGRYIDLMEFQEIPNYDAKR